MGSSMVMMWSCRVSLISSMMAARVVDLPEPVGPVRRMKPRGFWQNVVQRRGQVQFVDPLISTGMSRNAAPRLLRWKKAFTRNRARPGTE